MVQAVMVWAALACQENPQFESWKSFKPGSWVKHRMKMNAGGQEIESETTTTLLEQTAEKIVLEVKNKMTMGGQTMELPAQKQEVTPTADKAKQGDIKKVGDEKVEAAGKTYACTVYTTEVTESGQKMNGKLWISKDVPGGMVKGEFSGAQMPEPMRMTLLEFEKK